MEFGRAQKAKLPDSFPTFAWMLHTIARIQGKEYLQPEITQLLEQNKDKYSTTSESPEGWGYYDYFEWGVTEVTAWVGLALIQSLRTDHPKVWITQEERDAVKRRVRDIIQLLDKRQIPNVGGYSTINDVSYRN
jgi:hypothetical protein